MVLIPAPDGTCQQPLFQFGTVNTRLPQSGVPQASKAAQALMNGQKSLPGMSLPVGHKGLHSARNLPLGNEAERVLRVWERVSLIEARRGGIAPALLPDSVVNEAGFNWSRRFGAVSFLLRSWH